MAEGKTYVCLWKKTGAKTFEAWLAKKPRVRVTAESLEDVEELLQDAIGESNGDGEPQMEFEPLLPKKTGKKSLFKDGVIKVNFGSHFQFAEVESLFDQGFCRKCKWPIGKRTTHAIQVESIWPGDTSFSWHDRAGGTHLLICSERFLAIFTTAERRLFNLREVQMPAGKRKRMFEMIPKSVIPEVAGRGLKPDGWRCSICRTQVINHAELLDWGTSVACRADFGSRIPSMFFLGTQYRHSLCISARRWSIVKAAMRECSVTSSPVAVVEEADCFRKPKLSSFSDDQ